MTTVHVLILEAYLKKKAEADRLKKNLYTVKDEVKLIKKTYEELND